MPYSHATSLARQLRFGLPTEIKKQPDPSVYQLIKTFDLIYKFERKFVHGLYDEFNSICFCDKYSTLHIDQHFILSALDNPKTNQAKITRVALLAAGFDAVTHWGSGEPIYSRYAEKPRKNAGYTHEQRASLTFAGKFLITPAIMRKLKKEDNLTAGHLSELYQIPIFVTQGLIADFSFKLFKEETDNEDPNKYL